MRVWDELTRAQKALLFVTAAVFLLIFLVGCGASEGGQANPNDAPADIDYQGAPDGRDKQIVETFDSNVEVQAVTVDGIDCVVAVRNDQAGVALSCVSGDGSTSSTYSSEDDE